MSGQACRITGPEHSLHDYRRELAAFATPHFQTPGHLRFFLSLSFFSLPLSLTHTHTIYRPAYPHSFFPFSRAIFFPFCQSKGPNTQEPLIHSFVTLLLQAIFTRSFLQEPGIRIGPTNEPICSTKRVLFRNETRMYRMPRF